ncbi:hypothetical protein BKA80DRAFT_251315 [Phyllosticta citrichinensis]
MRPRLGLLIRAFSRPLWCALTSGTGRVDEESNGASMRRRGESVVHARYDTASQGHPSRWDFWNVCAVDPLARNYGFCAAGSPLKQPEEPSAGTSYSTTYPNPPHLALYSTTLRLPRPSSSPGQVPPLLPLALGAHLLHPLRSCFAPRHHHPVVLTLPHQPGSPSNPVTWTPSHYPTPGYISHSCSLAFSTNMITRESSAIATNMGRGAYDTTGAPKPPPPKKRR